MIKVGAGDGVLFSDDDLLPISALQHLLFCRRQCALIHIERVWVENRLTVEGRHLHEKAHGAAAGPRGGGRLETRPGVRTQRAVPLRSLTLGLYGVADVVEWRDDQPFPVEYKRGRPKKHDADRVQLCAQAMCLEEMLNATISGGSIFYARIRRREEVAFDAVLRATTLDAARRAHELIAAGRTPPAVYEPKCRRCSLIHICMPKTTGGGRSVQRYLRQSLQEMTGESAP